MDLILKPAGASFSRPGGRDGQWLGAIDPDDDDQVASPFDFAEVPGADAEAALVHLRRVFPGATPIVFGSLYEAGILFENMEVFEEGPADWLTEARTLDIEAWFDGRVAEAKEWQVHAGGVLPPRGRWPLGAKRATSLGVPIDQDTNQPHETVIVGLVPTAEAVEVAAYLHFGGWGDCPETPVHVALAREWAARYGARPAAATYETLEFQVERPVRDREEAVRLALEHYHYCRESVPETLQMAAASRVGATVWRFSWD
jgi:hypothetical protein